MKSSAAMVMAGEYHEPSRSLATPRIGIRMWMRRWLRIIPNLEPGRADRLGRCVPHVFFKSLTGLTEVDFLPGYCMIFRRAVVNATRFDEELPTYAAEERDFCIRVRQCWRLLLCNKLGIQHHNSPVSRIPMIERTFQSSFGAGRIFAKHSDSMADSLTLIHGLAGELLIDSLAFASNPSWQQLRCTFARMRGTIAGVKSFSKTTH